MNEHDIIYIKRTGFWVCKCGEAGRSEKSMKDHVQTIQLLDREAQNQPKQETCHV